MLIKPKTVKEIDDFAVRKLGIPKAELMRRAAEAVKRAVLDFLPRRGLPTVCVLLGGGNNGGDGYALATLLSGMNLCLYDVMGAGQSSDAGKYYLEECKSRGLKIENLQGRRDYSEVLSNADVIVDAVFGTGIRPPLPDFIRELCLAVEKSDAKKIAIDVPLGVNAETGEAAEYAPHYDATVELSFIKTGIVSYPAREFVGKIYYDNLGLPTDLIEKHFYSGYHYLDLPLAKKLLPKRPENSNKGSFGKLLMLTGSSIYQGASALALEAALRGGAGYVYFLGEREQNTLMRQRFPEAIYEERPPFAELSERDISDIVLRTSGMSAILIGSGATRSFGLALLSKAFLLTDGCPLIIDADAINALAELGEEGREVLKKSPRQVILTPHPLEFSRISGMSVEYISSHRLKAAESFAKEYSLILVLKGAATVITDGDEVYINSSGSSALAKGGSGDVLAGLIASLAATGLASPITFAALGCYFHGAAGDRLGLKYSTYGVTPSDLPSAVATEIARAQQAD